jgi:hypothetical protein
MLKHSESANNDPGESPIYSLHDTLYIYRMCPNALLDTTGAMLQKLMHTAQGIQTNVQ